VISVDLKIQEGNIMQKKINSEPQVHLEPLHVLHAILVLGVQAVQLHHPEHNDVLQPFQTKYFFLNIKNMEKREL
jgi:hypothetical protein